MSTKDKLIERFKSLPSDFTFDELIRLLSFYGYKLENKGQTSGSRVIFMKGNDSIMIHRPHPSRIVKKKALKYIKDIIKKEKPLWED